MLTALASATALTPPDNTDAPQWIHLLPAGTITTVDGRGPYRVRDAAKLASESMQAGGKLPIDENHAIDLTRPDGAAAGQPSPARAWITRMEARADGIWGEVEWTRSGAALMADRAYRGISPVFIHDKQNNVLRIARAALTNVPNLKGLTALHQAGDDSPAPPAEQTMEAVLAKLKTMLGLAADAEEEDIWRALSAVLSAAAAEKAKAASATAMQTQIAAAVGLGESATGEAVLGAVKQLPEAADPTKSPTVTALQTAVTELTKKLTALEDKNAKAISAGVIDKAIADKRVGINAANREQMIALHAQKPAEIEAWIAGLPQLGKSAAGAVPPAPTKDKDGNTIVALNAAQVNVAKVLGIKTEDMQKTLAAEAAEQEVA